MAKFNVVDNRKTGRGPIRTAVDATGAAQRAATHEGGTGYARDTKSELFMLAVTNLVGEDTFYETHTERDARFRDLVRACALTEPGWTAELIRWLRAEAHMRSAATVAAAEYAHARSQPDVDPSGTPAHATVRKVVGSALLRADEPGEFLGYWLNRFGRKLPNGVRRGLADAAVRLYTPRNTLKYDTASHPIRFGDVVDYVQVADALRDSATGRAQARTLGHLIDRRHGRADGVRHPVPPMLTLNDALRRTWRDKPEQLLDPDTLSRAGMTWEDVLSLAGSEIDKKQLWEAVIPSMGLMALARNLRNFDEAGVGDDTAAAVSARFADPEQVAKSRMFPFRWYQAYRSAPQLRWGVGLEHALTASCANIPVLTGRTLILIDTSGSMTATLSGRSDLRLSEAATVFAMALATRQPHGDVEVHGFGDHPYSHPLTRGAGPLRNITAFLGRGPVGGHGTAIAASIRQTYAGHDRVIVFTDMQTSGGDISYAVPSHVPLYGFNLGGYKIGGIDTTKPNRIELGGLSDNVFRLLPLLERGRDAAWPWQRAS